MPPREKRTPQPPPEPPVVTAATRWMLALLVSVSLGIGGWWAHTTWERIARAEDQLHGVDVRQQKLEVLVDQQREYNKALLDIVKQREEERRTERSEPVPVPTGDRRSWPYSGAIR